MENCLVTKLKSVVANDSLPKMGELVLRMKKTDYPTVLSQLINVGYNSAMYGSEQFDLRIVGNGHFSNTYDGESIGQTTTLSASHQFVYVSNTDCIVFISNKYKIKCLTGAVIRGTSSSDLKSLSGIEFVNVSSSGYVNNGDLAFNSSPFNVNTLSTRIRYYNSQYTKKARLNLNETLPFNKVALNNLTIVGDVSGDIDSLKVCVGLTTLSLGSNDLTKVIGDIASLSTLVNLTAIDLAGMVNVNGTLEDFCSGLFANGKHSGTVSANLQATGVTLNGVSATNYNFNCAFTDNSVTVRNSLTSTVIATYNGSSWTYNS